MRIFSSDEDRGTYLRILSDQICQHGVSVLSYCLMKNHVHFVAVPEQEKSLARAFGEAHRRYTLLLNNREGVRGYLFQGRFFSCPLDEGHTLAAARYVERNPVRAGIVRQPWEYRWSSAQYHLGLHNADPLVRNHDRDLLGLVTDWRDFLRTDSPEAEMLREHTRTGRPCGDDRFMIFAEQLTNRKLQRRSAGRPRKR